MSPMEHQQLANLLNSLALPARHMKALGEDLKTFRCGMDTNWIEYLINLLSGGPVALYGVIPSKKG